jgi:integron integrase
LYYIEKTNEINTNLDAMHIVANSVILLHSIARKSHFPQGDLTMPPRKLLDQVRDAIRRKHYSLKTE